MDWNEAVALVTGGASGLGAAVTERLTALGARVVVADLTEPQGVGAAVSYVRTDVGNADDMEEAVGAAVSLGSLRVAVGCAGIDKPTPRMVGAGLRPHDLETFERYLRVHLVGAFNLVRLAGAAMGALAPDEGGERGVIVNVASIAGFDGGVAKTAYSAAKAGVIGMTLPAAQDLAPLGIRVVAIAPGPFDTPMAADVTPEVRANLDYAIPFPARLGQPEEFAALVQHLCENPYVNGTVVRLDAGARLPYRWPRRPPSASG
jgi:NAD(P)-dependent dehydrogenase (short-subunit alcohol dehydrogenase family)